MPGVVCRRAAVALLSLAAIGCQQNTPLASAPPPQLLEQQQAALVAQQEQLQSRASTLDLDNQELQVKLAQAQQQNRLLEDQVAVMRDQLQSTTTQLAQLREAHSATEQQAQAMVASLRKRSGATITANSSLQRNLPAINIPGVEIRPDGDVVRIEMPADRLFTPGTAQLSQTGATLLAAVAAETVRSYPNQIIGVEGHTDSDLMSPAGGLSNHQFSVARATTVLDYLTRQARLPPQQLFLVGHGANHPVVSNATGQGKARNRRIELVVYPEQWKR